MKMKEHNVMWWPSLAVLGLPACLVAVRASPFVADFFWVLLGVPLVLLLWGGGSLLALRSAIASAKHRAWPRMASGALFPLCMLAVGLRPMDFVRQCNYWGDVVHFQMSKSQYLQQVAGGAEGIHPNLVVFNRGGMVWSSNGVVFDESDEIKLPFGQQSDAWRARAAGTELSCGFQVIALGDHFYLAEFGC